LLFYKNQERRSVVYDEAGKPVIAWRANECALVVPILTPNRVWMGAQSETQASWIVEPYEELAKAALVANVKAEYQGYAANDIALGLWGPSGNTMVMFDRLAGMAKTFGPSPGLGFYQPYPVNESALMRQFPEFGRAEGWIWNRQSNAALPLLQPGNSISVLDVKSDGSTLAWVEAKLPFDMNGLYQSADLWTSPFATDKSGIVATKRRALPALGEVLSHVSDGFYALYAFGDKMVHVYRLSDARHWAFNPPRSLRLIFTMFPTSTRTTSGIRPSPTSTANRSRRSARATSRPERPLLAEGVPGGLRFAIMGRMQHAPASWVLDLSDPRAPTQAIWDAMTPAERQRVVDTLPSEFEVDQANPPEGDFHFEAKASVKDTLRGYFERIGRKVYLAAELPVYYPGEGMFAPDIMAVVDVETRQRNGWTVSAEGKGLDFAMEILWSGRSKKDLEDNVTRFAALGITEYFVFDRRRLSLRGYRLLEARARRYQPLLAQQGRFSSVVLGLELGIEGDKLRFYHGTASVEDTGERITKLGTMVGDLVARIDEAERRAEEAERQIGDEKRRADELARRLEAALAEIARRDRDGAR
jgi:Uma2 family endonuclease